MRSRVHGALHAFVAGAVARPLSRLVSAVVAAVLRHPALLVPSGESGRRRSRPLPQRRASGQCARAWNEATWRPSEAPRLSPRRSSRRNLGLSPRSPPPRPPSRPGPQWQTEARRPGPSRLRPPGPPRPGPLRPPQARALRLCVESLRDIRVTEGPSIREYQESRSGMGVSGAPDIREPGPTGYPGHLRDIRDIRNQDQGWGYQVLS